MSDVNGRIEGIVEAFVTTKGGNATIDLRLNVPSPEAQQERGYTGAINAVRREDGTLGEHLALSDVAHFGPVVDEIVKRVQEGLAA